MKKITPEQYRNMPWKNGAGTTIEMAIFPEHASLHDFDWRVSRAAVPEDGSFSHFDGIDRSLALLDGPGMRLKVNDVLHQVDAVNNIAVFAGEAATHAELIDGPITDFNLMSRRGLCTHQLSHWAGQATRALPKECALLYCAKGSGTLVTDQGNIELLEDETMLFGAAAEVTPLILHTNPGSRFYCVQIFR